MCIWNQVHIYKSTKVQCKEAYIFFASIKSIKYRYNEYNTHMSDWFIVLSAWGHCWTLNNSPLVVGSNFDAISADQPIILTGQSPLAPARNPQKSLFFGGIVALDSNEQIPRSVPQLTGMMLEGMAAVISRIIRGWFNSMPPATTAIHVLRLWSFVL